MKDKEKQTKSEVAVKVGKEAQKIVKQREQSRFSEYMSEVGRNIAKIVRLLSSIIINITILYVIASKWITDPYILTFITIIIMLDTVVRAFYFID